MSQLTDGVVHQHAPTRVVTPGGHDLNRWNELRQTAERWGLSELLRRLGVGPGAGLLVLAAHPDDETLGLGRLMHTWSQRVGPVAAVVATAGEACVDHVGPRPDGLAERRLAEWVAATEVLGVGRRSALGFPDGALSEHETAMVAALESAADAFSEASEIVLAAPWRQDPHPDHRAVGRVAEQVAARRRLPAVAFGVWMTYWSEPDELAADRQRLVVLTTDQSDEAAHRRACAEFVSQLTPLGPGLTPVVPPDMLAHHHQQLLVLPGAEERP